MLPSSVLGQSVLVALVCLVGAASAGCRAGEPPTRSRAEALSASARSVPTVAPAPAPPPPPSPPSLPPPPENAVVETLAVGSDVPASLVRSADGSAPRVVFLPGLCSNANAYLQSFPEAARRAGGTVALEGDQPCMPGFRSFSWDATKLHARIEAATRAAGVASSAPLTLVGYSQGAALAEQLVQRYPERYARIVLIGAPTEPSAAKLAPARAVVTMSCSRDVPARMKEASRRLARAGVPSTYVEMPGCTHGNIAEGERVFDEAFAWLDGNAR